MAPKTRDGSMELGESNGTTKLTGEKETVKRPDDTDDFSDLDRGWSWVVLFASFCVFCINGGTSYAVGIMHLALLGRFGASVSVTSFAGALHTALLNLAAPLATIVIDKYSCRTAIVLSGIFFMCGYIATAFAPSIEVAIFTMGILSGIGGGLSYTSAMVAVGFNFKKRRNLALGIANSGVGFGLFAMAPVMQIARDYYGNAGVFIIIAGMAANLITFGTLCFPSQLEKHTQKQRKLDARRVNPTQSQNNCVTSLKPYIKVLLNKGIICLCSCMFFYCIGLLLLYLHLPTYIETKGFTALEAAFFVSLSGIVSIFGRLFTGFIANFDSISEIIPYAGTIGIISMGTFLYPLISSSYSGQIVYVLIFGLFFGSCNVVTATVSLKFVDIKSVSAAIGLEFMFGGIGAIIGPVLAGFLVDNGGTYNQSIIIAASCLLGASLFGASSAFFQKPTYYPPAVQIPIIDENEQEVDKTE